LERSKFNVSKDSTKRTCNGIVFDSEMEMKYYRDVILSQVESGNIVKYELQKTYILQPKFTYNGKSILPIKYVADFWVLYSDGTEETIDTKGMPDNIAKLKRKLFWYSFPNIKYRWVCWSKIDGGWCDYEQVEKARKERKKLKK